MTSPRRPVTSDDDVTMTSNDVTASLFIGALLFVPVGVILCVTVVIRLRKNGTTISITAFCVR